MLLLGASICMPLEIPSKKRVSVQQEPYCFIVLIDSRPVLRCAARRDALRYAVMVRRALLRANVIKRGGTTPVRRALVARKIHN